jgi:hypothetical protein
LIAQTKDVHIKINRQKAARLEMLIKLEQKMLTSWLKFAPNLEFAPNLAQVC